MDTPNENTLLQTNTENMKISDTYANQKTTIATWAFILMTASIILSSPFFSTEFLATGDTQFHLNRIEGIREELSIGEFPVRINSYCLNGYGTADCIMYPDLFLYLPAVLRLMDVSVGVSYNIFWIFVTFFGVFSAWLGYYIWCGSIKYSAVMALIYNSVYSCLIHHGMSPGDYPAICVLPLAFGSLLAILKAQNGTRFWPLFVIAITVAAQSHVLTTLLIVMVSLGILIIYHNKLRDKSRRNAILKAIGFCVLLNAWRYVPLAYFYETITFQIFSKPWSHSLHDVTLDLPKLFQSQFFFGYPIILLTIFFALKHNPLRNRNWLLVLVFNTLLAVMLWEKFPWTGIESLFPDPQFLPNKFQYPHRFFLFGIPFLCKYLGQFTVDLFVKTAHTAGPAFIGLACCCIGIYSAFYGSYFFGVEQVGMGVYSPADTVPSYGQQEDYLYNDVSFKDLKNRDGNTPGPNDIYSIARIYNTVKTGTHLSFSYDAPENCTVQVPLFYWPGYTAVNQLHEKLSVHSAENHIMEVNLPQGSGTVQINYTGPWFFRLADVVSMLSLILFIISWKRTEAQFS